MQPKVENRYILKDIHIKPNLKTTVSQAEYLQDESKVASIARRNSATLIRYWALIQKNCPELSDKLHIKPR